MAAELNQDTRKQLNRFRRRWKFLNRVRGLCGAFTVLLIVGSVAALADGLMMVADSTRYSFSAAAYTLAFLVWFILSGRFVFSPLNDREIARRFETRWPGLEGKVLAAVELAETRKEAHMDSSAFRELLQSDVAALVKPLHMRAVLPGSVVNSWVLSFMLVGAMVGGMFVLPGIEFAPLFARALAPMAGIERPSRVKVELIEPGPDTQWLPVGDEVKVVVKTIGPRPDSVRLQAWYEDTERSTTMVAMGDGTYAGKLTIGAEDIRFRVKAGDGATKILTLPTKSRPHVEHYEKEYRYPDYASQAPHSIREADGDLAALEGTRVKLRMKINQEVSAGELVIASETKTNVVNLTVVRPDLIEADLVLTNHATYQVHLVGKETGFKNQFVPKYEIKPWPDRLPKVRLASPENESVVAVDERLLVSGSAQDDIGLTGVAQSFQINGGEWREISFVVSNPTNASLQRTWDLILMNLDKGDRIRTKLVATDLKGNIAESETVQLVIGNPTITTTAAEELVQWNRVGEALAAVGEAVAGLRGTVAGENVAKFRDGNKIMRSQMSAGMRTAVGEVDGLLQVTDREVAKTMQAAAPGRESARLGLLGQGLSHARHALMPPIEAEITALAKGDAGDLTPAGKQTAALSSHLAKLTAAYKSLQLRKKSGAAAEYFEQLAKRQDEIVSKAKEDADTDPNVWRRLARRQSEAASQIAKGEELLTELGKEAPGRNANRLRNAQKEVNATRQTLERVAADEEAKQELLPPSETMQKQVRAAEKNLRTLAKEQFVAADRAERALAALSEPPSRQVQRANYQLRQIEKAADRGDIDADRKRGAELNSVSARMRDLARLEEQRREGDPLLASELGTAAMAMENLAGIGNLEVADDEGSKLAQAEKNLKSIEAAHRVADFEQALKQLARQEQWEGDATNQKTDRTTDWDWLTDEVVDARNEAKRAGLPDAVVKALDRLAHDPARREISSEMVNRKQGDMPKPMGQKLGKLGEIASEARFASQAAREMARQQLESLAPKLSDRLSRLAGVAQIQEEEARRAAQEPNPARAAMAQLGSEQELLNQRVGQNLESIRREGNRQNVFTPEGREQARDADDAMAMISGPASTAAQSMAQANSAANPEERQAALGRTAEANRQLAESLRQVAQHMRQVEAGFPEDSRQALRAREEELGIREQLDRRYAAAEGMQQLAQRDPQALQQALGEQIQNNPELRAEVQRMTQQALEGAENSVADAQQAAEEAAQELRAADNSPAARERFRQELSQAADAAREMAEGPLEGMQAANPNNDNLREAGRQMREAAGQNPPEGVADPQQMAQLASNMQNQLNAAADQLNGAARSQPGEEAAATRQMEQEARAMARAAEQMSETLKRMGQSSPEEAMQSAARSVEESREQVQAAAEQLRQSARDTAPIDSAASEQMQQSADRAEQIAERELNNAQAELQEDNNLADASRSVEQAQQAMENLRDSMEPLMEAQQGGSEQNGQPEQSGQQSAQSGQSGQSAPSGQSQAGQSGQQSAQSGQSGQSAPGGQSQAGQSGQQSAQSGQSGQSAQSGQSQAGQSGQQSGQSGQASGSSSGQGSGAQMASSGGAGGPSGQSGGGSSGSGQSPDGSAKSGTPTGGMRSGGEGSPDGAGSGSGTGQWLARAMSAMRDGSGEQISSQARDALRAAFESQASAIRMERNADAENMKLTANSVAGSGSVPTGREGEGPGGGEHGPMTDNEAELDMTAFNVDWGKLPPRVARDLRNSMREGVASEFRDQVNTYFRVIAEQASAGGR